jgi:hypothetical protein
LASTLPPAELRRVLARPPLSRYRADPARLMADVGLSPDPWQTDLLRSSAPRTLILASRQVGKSQTSAALALREALLSPNRLVLLVSPSLRQSGELFRDKVMPLYRRLGRPVAAVRETALELALANGSRVVSLPGSEATIRGFSSVALLVIDEAARVKDALYYACRPMLAASGGALVAVTSAYAKAGWFYEAWSGAEPWRRVRVRATDCPRIAPAFLAEERAALGGRWFGMEYMTEFGEAVDAVFSHADIGAAFGSDDARPLWGAKA